ncbi:MAG: NADH:flavin oxidoreductase [Vulcanimicrobiota bacterium]
MEKTNILFQPFNLGKIQVNNRIVRSATSERLADEQGRATDELIETYKKLGQGKIGLVVTGYAYVNKAGRCNTNQLGVHEDVKIPGLKKLCQEFHSENSLGRIALQIVHGGRQVSPDAGIPMAPSNVPFKGEPPRVLQEREIEQIIEDFAQAALRGKRAGFDAVQIHAAHGFLISQFLSPYTNRRNDFWGGSLSSRARFFIEIIKECRQKTGEDYPLFAKMNCSDFIEEGLTVEEAGEIAEMAEKAGLDGLEISGGIGDTPEEKGACRPVKDKKDEAYFLEEAKKISNELGIPVILVGGIRNPQTAENILKETKIKAIAMSRPFLDNPGLVLEWMEKSG